MQFELTDEQEALCDTVRRFVASEVLPIAGEIDRTDSFPRGIYRRMAELGLLGMTLPDRYGGSGIDTLTWVTAQEELARGSACVADAQMLCKLMSDVILANASEEQKNAILPALANGTKICAIAQTEPAAGSDVAGVRTTARPTADGYVLNGGKHFITAATVCDLAVVVASVDLALGRDGIGLFLVDANTPGFVRGAPTAVMGVRGLGTGEISFQDCRVPAEAMIGQPGEGFGRAMASLNTGRIGIAAQAVGIAQAALDEALAYVQLREAFGQKIANFQAVRFMLADCSTEIEAARLLVWRAAYTRDRGRQPIREAAEAKLFASTAAAHVVDIALQIHGAVGYSPGARVERLYRDARVYRIWEGTSEIQRVIISRQLLAEAGYRSARTRERKQASEEPRKIKVAS